MGAIEQLLDSISLPKFAKATQNFDDTCLLDAEITTTITSSFDTTGLIERILPGQRIAITAGSRGIDRIDQVMLCVVNLVKAQGATAYIVPCMGSHGGGNAHGQREVLHHLGIDETTMGAEIIAQDDLVEVGLTDDGHMVYADAFLAGCDGILALNRVKKHTMFTAPVESGVLKIMAVGMGKQKGAESCHADGPTGMYDRVVSHATTIMKHLPVIGGVALVENALGKLCLCEAMLAENIVKRESEILTYANTRLPQILFDDLDLLIVCQVGKDVSGSGMDTNVIGRFASPAIKGVRKSNRLVALSLTEATDGNGQGMGYADFISQRLFGEMDRAKTYLTVLTNHVVVPSFNPPIMPNDLYAIRAGIKTSPNPSPENLRCMVILNTHALSEVYVSEAMAEEVEQHPQADLVGTFAPLPFGETGDLAFDTLY